MTYDAFNAFCRELPATTYTMQWRGSHVWKVGGKVFAIAGSGENGLSITVKVSEIAFEVLKDKPGLRPAPYLAPRGMTWIQHYALPGLPDDALLNWRHRPFLALPARARTTAGAVVARHRSLATLIVTIAVRRQYMAH